MFDIVSMGGALFDMMPIAKRRRQGDFSRCSGGATLNCMSQLSHLGFKTSYISAVGEDSFGKILPKAVARKIRHAHVSIDGQHDTCLCPS